MKMIVRGVTAMLLVCALGFGSAALAQQPSPVEPTAQPKVQAAAKKAGTAKAPATPKAEMVPTWYAQALAQGPGALNITHFWSKGSRLRAETVISGRKVVTLVNGDWYYAYDATKGLGIRVHRTPEAIANDADYRGFRMK